MPKMEVPAAFREFAEKGVSQAKENYEKMKAAAEEATDVLEDTLRHGHQGRRRLRAQADRGRAASTPMRPSTSTPSLFDVKSYSDVVELSTAHARKQFEAVTAQTKDLAALAQKVATETAEPIKGSVTKAFSKVA